MSNVNQLKGLVKERIAQAIGALTALQEAIELELEQPAPTLDTPPIHRPTGEIVE